MFILVDLGDNRQHAMNLTTISVIMIKTRLGYLRLGTAKHKGLSKYTGTVT